jgi:hypothetical protein
VCYYWLVIYSLSQFAALSIGERGGDVLVDSSAVGIGCLLGVDWRPKSGGG